MKIPKKVTLKEAANFFRKVGLGIIVKESKKFSHKKSDSRFSKGTYGPEILDLYRLHKFITLNKRTRVLEYGTGWSSLVIYNALKINRKKYSSKPFPRNKKPYSLTIVDNSKKYLNISKRRIQKLYSLGKDIKFHYSKNKMTMFKKKYASHYVSHPLINPDFIYLDGPDQFQIKGKINNFTISDFEMMPMNCDILKFEHFLTPGTIILTDGRTANGRFLNSNFQRKWKYIHDEINDQSIFYLNEKSLGKFNKFQLSFYKNN